MLTNLNIPHHTPRQAVLKAEIEAWSERYAEVMTKDERFGSGASVNKHGCAYLAIEPIIWLLYDVLQEEDGVEGKCGYCGSYTDDNGYCLCPEEIGNVAADQCDYPSRWGD